MKQIAGRLLRAALLVLSFSCSFFTAPQSAMRSTADFATNADFQSWYAGYNEEYFFNRLPKDTEISWGNLTPINAIGTTVHRESGSFSIFIDRTLNPTVQQARMTEIHEICHIATWGQEFDQHASKFQGCMVNLAVHGAFADLW
jgi:hypothetical protein